MGYTCALTTAGGVKIVRRPFHDERVRKLTADVDRPMAALLNDLKSRGMLDDTLVIWGGEFGRTPTTEPGAGGGGGRDHNHWGFSMWMAGGGV